MKTIRLDRAAYEDGAVFSVTIATAKRQPVFHDAAQVARCVGHLRATATRYEANVFACCFIPDHVHLLVAVPAGTNLVNVIRHFKQLTAHDTSKLPGRDIAPFWQRRFYDHALRATEAIEKVADYIWDNPVRAGLISEADDYPFSGSLVWDVRRSSGSEDPDLRGRDPPSRGLKTPTYAAGIRPATNAS
jgi:putative transposase